MFRSTHHSTLTVALAIGFGGTMVALFLPLQPLGIRPLRSRPEPTLWLPWAGLWAPLRPPRFWGPLMNA